MDEPKEQPTQSNQPPVMDVVPPPSTPDLPDEQPNQPLPTSSDQPMDSDVHHHTQDQPKQTSPKNPPAKKSATLAIVATVIVVIVLAALATYAYIKTK
jgi:hypothetical protein